MATARPSQVRRILARNLRRLRHLRGLSQEKLALEVELRQAQISELESASSNITIDNLAKLAAALGVRTWELLDDRK